MLSSDIFITLAVYPNEILAPEAFNLKVSGLHFETNVSFLIKHVVWNSNFADLIQVCMFQCSAVRISPQPPPYRPSTPKLYSFFSFVYLESFSVDLSIITTSECTRISLNRFSGYWYRLRTPYKVQGHHKQALVLQENIFLVCVYHYKLYATVFNILQNNKEGKQNNIANQIYFVEYLMVNIFDSIV